MKHGVLIPAVVFLVSTTAGAFPAGSGGGSSSDSENASIEGWLALGAAALVAGILIWDVVRGFGEKPGRLSPRLHQQLTAPG